MRLLRWVSQDDGMHLQGREPGKRSVEELGVVIRTRAGYAWETADGMYGALEPTMQHAMTALERQVRYR